MPIFNETTGFTNRNRLVHQPDDGQSPHFGPETIIRYNNILLNDYRFADKYQITEISGIDDADIRDSRADIADDHGETAYNAFYGGRTISLRGKIIAGNLNKLRDMTNTLKTAFSDLTEQELSFMYRDFDVINYDADWTNDFLSSSTANITPTGDNLTYQTTAIRTSLLDFKGTMGPDLEAIQKVTIGSTLGGDYTCICKGVNATNDYLGASLTATQFKIKIVLAGVATTLDSVNFIPNVNTSYWIKVNIILDTPYAELWDVKPNDNGIPLHILGNVSLDGSQSPVLGRTINGYAGFSMTAGASDSTFKVHELSIRNGGLSDVSIKCRKFGKIELLEAQNNQRLEREFLITLRASYPAFINRSTNVVNTSLNTVGLIFPGGGGPLIFPANGSGITFLPTTLTLTNSGNFIHRPLIRIEGTISDFAINNLTTQQSISVPTLNLASATNYVYIDCYKRTITDDTGANLYKNLTSDSEWIEFISGGNQISFGKGDNATGSTITIYSRHAWL